MAEIRGARVIAVLGDSVTTDHISPAGSIKKDSPAGRYLSGQGVALADFNSYGSRRGNHEVLVRGTFANTRIRNRLAPNTEGGVTTYLPTGEVMPIYDAAMRYQADGTPLLVLAGKEYGSGSSRDWAAKGPALQGIRAVIAESYERIHRSNLVGMGILPLQFGRWGIGRHAGTHGPRGLRSRRPGRCNRHEIRRRPHPPRAGAEGGRHIGRFQRHHPDRHAAGGALLPARRDPSVRAAAAPLGPPEAAGHRRRTLHAGATYRPPARRKVDEGSIESFPASDPPAY